MAVLEADGDPVQETQPPTQTTGPVTETTEAAQSIPETTAAAAEQETAAELVEYGSNVIPTPYFTLTYPEELADHLTVVKSSDDPVTLEFYAILEDRPEQRIFDLRLGADVSGNMGMVKTPAGDIRVDLILYAFEPGEDWSEGEINTVLAMQEAANDMLEQLELAEVPENGGEPGIVETAPESSVVNMHAIRTPYCTLQYPAAWKTYLVTEQPDNPEAGVYRVLFYGQLPGKEKCMLFSVLFGGDAGEQLGSIVQDSGEFVTVNILVETLDLSGWNEEDTQLLLAMQEAVNELIARLPLE